MGEVDTLPVGYVNRLSNPTQISGVETSELEIPVFSGSEVERWRRVAKNRLLTIREIKAELGDALDRIAELRRSVSAENAGTRA